MGLDTVEIVLHRCLMRLLAERYQRDGLALIVDPDITWNLLVPLIVEHTGLRPEQIRPDAEWGRDLGID